MRIILTFTFFIFTSTLSKASLDPRNNDYFFILSFDYDPRLNHPNPEYKVLNIWETAYFVPKSSNIEDLVNEARDLLNSRYLRPVETVIAYVKDPYEKNELLPVVKHITNSLIVEVEIVNGKTSEIICRVGDLTKRNLCKY